jgi:hypothetical protein
MKLYVLCSKKCRFWFQLVRNLPEEGGRELHLQPATRKPTSESTKFAKIHSSHQY